MTVYQARLYARNKLIGKNSSTELDILVLLAHLFNSNTSYILAHPELELKEKTNQFKSFIKKRTKGIPVAYLTHSKEFWGLNFFVNSNVLIPKPDTETLVERAIFLIQAKLSSKTPFYILDVCTGSGCIAIALKYSCPQASVYASDICPHALNIAQINSKKLVSNSICFFQNDLRKSLLTPKNETNYTQGFYDLIVSNPPYIPHAQATKLLKDGRSEPMLALDGGKDGMDLIKPLIKNAYPLLKSKASILIEIDEDIAQQTADLLDVAGYISIRVHKDLNNQDRVVEGSKP